MKVKVTNTMARALTNHARNNNHPYKFTVINCGQRDYSIHIGDPFTAFDYGDYSVKTGLFKAIRVDYSPECYALPAYLTTEYLNKLYRPGMSLNEYMESVMDCIYI